MPKLNPNDYQPSPELMELGLLLEGTTEGIDNLVAFLTAECNS